MAEIDSMLGLEHRIGAKLYPWEFNDTADEKYFTADALAMLNNLYHRALESQISLCGIERFNGSMSDFKRDQLVNTRYGFSYNTYTLEIPIHDVHFFNLKKLIRMNPKVYSMSDMFKYQDVFVKRLMFFIDGSYYSDLKFYTDGRIMIIAISCDDNSISLNNIKEHISLESEWSILTIPFSSTRKYVGPSSDILKNGKLIFNNATSLSGASATDKNMWMVTYSTDRNNHGIKTILFTTASTENGILSASLTDSVIEDISSSPSYCSVEITAIPNAAGYSTINRARAFELPMNPNPVPPESILIFEIFDDGIVDYLHGITINQYYPNIYTLENVPDDANIFVVWCYSEASNLKFDNPLKDYIVYDTDYAGNVINGTLPEIVKSYVPAVHTFNEKNYADYYWQATRFNKYTYRLETIKNLVKDNPDRLRDVYEKYLIRTEYDWFANPKFIIDMKLWGSLSKRACMDNSICCTSSGKEEFPYPHIYVTFHHEDDRVYPVSVWINGMYYNAKYQYTEKYTTYVFLPVYLLQSKPIVELELIKVRSTYGPHTETFKLPGKYTSLVFPGESYTEISPQNLMVAVAETIPDYNGGTQIVYRVADDYEMYWLLFGRTMYMSGVPEESKPEPADDSTLAAIKDFDNNVLLQDDTVLMIDGVNSYETGKREYFIERAMINKNGFFMVKDDEYEGYTDPVSVRTMGYFGETRHRFHKHIACKYPDMVYITPITDYFSEKTVRVTNTDIYKKWQLIADYNESTESVIINIPSFIYDPSPTKFRVFANGRLCDPYHDYVIDANVDNGFYLFSDVNIAIVNKNYLHEKNNEIVVEYIPYKYGLVFRAKPKSQKLILRRNSATRPFSTKYYDVYINGKKCTDDEITINTASRITLTPYIGEDTIVSIYERMHDEDIYGNADTMITSLNDQFAKEITGFGEFIHPSFIKTPTTSDMSYCVGCATTCGTTCVGTCSNTCNGCTEVCTGCVGTCVNECTDNCDSTCGESCTNTCDGTCDTDCEGKCKNGCIGTCIGNCNGSCIGSCVGSCTESCFSTCVGMLEANPIRDGE